MFCGVGATFPPTGLLVIWSKVALSVALNCPVQADVTPLPSVTVPDMLSTASVLLLSKVKITGDTVPGGKGGEFRRREHEWPFVVAPEQSCGSVKSPGPSEVNRKSRGVPFSVMKKSIGKLDPMFAILPSVPAASRMPAP